VVNYIVDYTVELANRFLETGVHALAFFNPVSSSHIMKLDEYRLISLEADKKFYKLVKGAAVFALAGSETPGILPTLIDEVGIPGIVVSYSDNLRAIKEKYGKKLILIGNLDNIAMTHWNEEKAESEVRRCINDAASGGGYIICDHHGDIPSSVSERILHKIAEARNKWGVYQ
ncbi:MAG: uroporphyrinogen decarboxylase family protein, partial [Candidatus Thorarchaeota archaeon]